MAIRNREQEATLDQIAWAEHALENFDIQRAEGVEKPRLSDSLVEEARAIGGIPHETLATMGLKALSRTHGEYWMVEVSAKNGVQHG